jgi:hypothetical protein
MSSIITIKETVDIAASFEDRWVQDSNTYLGIGRVTPWMNNVPPISNNSTDFINFVYDRLVALVKITAADMRLVIPRVDWNSGTVYTAYDNGVDMFVTEADIAQTGTITATSGLTTLSGVGTTFATNFTAGNFIKFIDPATDNIYIKEIISVTNDTSLVVNSAFTSTVTTSNFYKYNNTYPYYGYPFYVRNTYDQIYKCLYNNKGAQSTVMPQISLAGDLPSNPWIETSDGYKWKYMYTIPSGLKEKFFTPQWMPVSSDGTVTAAAVNGRIDIVDILQGGSGYNSGVACTSAQILTVTGDGSGANITAVVDSSGTIIDTNILNGGSGYTYATITANPGVAGVGANLKPVISPSGGHGSDNIDELGAKNVMVCVELPGNDGGVIPIGSSLSTTPFTYYQVSIIQNPLLSATGEIASGSAYNTTTQILTGTLISPYYFPIADIAYQGLTLDTATFTGSIVTWDNINNIVYLNNIRGSFTPYSSFTSSLLGRTVTAFSLVKPEIELYTGKLLYVQNRAPISRSINQTEQIKIVIEI